MGIKAIETHYKGYRFRSSGRMSANLSNPLQVFGTGQNALCDIALFAAGNYVSRYVSKIVDDSIDPIASIAAVRVTFSSKNGTGWQFPAVFARHLRKGAELFSRKFKNVTSLTGAFLVVEEKAIERRLTRRECIVPASPQRLDLQATTTASRSIYQASCDYVSLLAAITLTQPNSVSTLRLTWASFSSNVLQNNQPAKSLPCVVNGFFASCWRRYHKGYNLSAIISLILPELRAICQFASEHGESG